jgi:hypothetical protein
MARRQGGLTVLAIENLKATMSATRCPILFAPVFREVLGLAIPVRRQAQEAYGRNGLHRRGHRGDQDRRCRDIADAARVQSLASSQRTGPLSGGRPDTAAALIGALERAGVEFIPDNGGGAGVRLARRSEKSQRGW